MEPWKFIFPMHLMIEIFKITETARIVCHVANDIICINYIVFGIILADKFKTRSTK